MADIPADHPAVTVPQQVLANRSQLLASAAAVNPGVKGGVQTAAAASTRNAQEVMLEKLYPNDKNMTKVEVEPYSGNPNKLVNSPEMKDIGAWTNSKKLIYYKDDFPEHFKAYILYHEGIHIKQFRKTGKPPSSYEEMLGFELSAYPKTETWVKSSAGEKFFTDNGLEAGYYDVVDLAEAATAAASALMVNSVAGLIVQVVTHSSEFLWNLLKYPITLDLVLPGTSFDQIIFLNMVANGYLPPQKTTVLFEIKDLYAQKGADYWKQFGY